MAKQSKKHISKVSPKRADLTDHSKVGSKNVPELDRGSNRDFYNEEKPPQINKIQFVNFLLGKEWYGVEISRVRDVTMVSEVTDLPCAPNYITGIANLRGNILSITDLKKIFGLEPTPLTKESRFLVLEIGELNTGVIVDGVSKVIDVALNKIDPALETLEPERAEYIKGVCKSDDVFFAILNVERIFALGTKEQ